MQAFISGIRFFLNCWVIASLISVVITSGDHTVGFLIFQFNTSSILLIAVLFTWLGMKTIAGYSWIVFILAGISHAQEVDAAMGKTGAVFIITFAISMLLQIENYAHIQNFADDFRVAAGKYSGAVKESLRAAGNDASSRASAAADEAKRAIHTLHMQ